MQGGSGFLAADGQTLSVADDDRPAVCERFYRIAVRTVDRYGTGGVDEMPAASRADGGQAFGEVETGVVYGWDQFPFSDFETPQSVPDEEFAPVGRSFGPANGVSDERLQVRQAHQRGFEQPGDAIADGIARLFEQCEAFCVGRTAVPDDFPGREQQSLSPVVAGEQSGLERQRVQGRGDRGDGVVVDRRVEILRRASGVLVGCRAQFGTFLSGEDGKKHRIEIHRTERAALVQQNIFGFQVPVRPVAFEKFQRQAVELSGQVAEVRFVAGAGAPRITAS